MRAARGRLAPIGAALVLLAACDRQGGDDRAPPLAKPDASRSAGTCSEPQVTGVSLVLFASEGTCLPGDIMVLFRCSPAAQPVLRVASETGPVSFLGGPYAIPVSTLPANVRFAGTGDGLEVLIADPVRSSSTASPGGSPSLGPSPEATPGPITDGEPLVYVRHDEVTERWLQLERKRALNHPPVAWLIGDSILDGGKDDVATALRNWDLTIDAEVGRPSSSGIELAQQAADANADAVLIELGTNDRSEGELRDDMTQILVALRGVPMVVWQTVRGPADDPRFPAFNAVIRQVAAGYPNVVIADWASFAPEDAFQTDGIHPDVGFEDLESNLLGPLFSDWFDVMSTGAAAACTRRVVDATS